MINIDSKMNKKILETIANEFEDSIINLSVSIDTEEIQKKYKSGKELSEIEKACLIPFLDNEEEIEKIMGDNKELKGLYNNIKEEKENPINKYLDKIESESKSIGKEIIESKYFFNLSYMVEQSSKIGYNSCIASIIENMKKNKYSKEEIEKILNINFEKELTEEDVIEETEQSKKED